MQVSPVEKSRPEAKDGTGSVRVWIETERGPIARGVAEVLAADGASVRLTEATCLAPGDDVDVRLSYDLDAPTLAATARILWVRSDDETTECELKWTHSGPEREQLGSLIAACA